MLAPYSEASKPVSQDWGKVVGRCWRFILKQAKPVSQDWGKVVGRCWRLILKQPNLCWEVLAPYSEASKPVSQDWGKVVGRCWRLILKQANLSARIGIELLGGAGALF